MSDARTRVFAPVELLPGVFRFDARFGNGFSANMHALRLPDGGLFLHSPVWGGDATFDAVDRLGPVRVLFAPNHYHHLSLPRYVARYPHALAVASKGALPRLRKQGHATLRDADEAPLPARTRWLDPDGLRNGERWLALDRDDGTTWLVSDAFMNVNHPVPGATGVLLRLWQVLPGPQVSRTWRWVGLADRKAYTRWCTEALRRERPVRLLVGHGDPLDAPDLVEAMTALVVRRLG